MLLAIRKVRHGRSGHVMDRSTARSQHVRRVPTQLFTRRAETVIGSLRAPEAEVRRHQRWVRHGTKLASDNLFLPELWVPSHLLFMSNNVTIPLQYR